LPIGTYPDRLRRARWTDGARQAVAVAGSSVARGIAEDMILAHAAPSRDGRARPPHLASMLRDDVLFYILPRISPDGAELVLSTGAYVRSNPRDERDRVDPFFRAADVDGDGQARVMRRQDPAGDFVAWAEDQNLL